MNGKRTSDLQHEQSEEKEKELISEHKMTSNQSN